MEESRAWGRGRRLLFAALLSGVLLTSAGLALAATGDLDPAGCISDVGDPAGCGGDTQQGLDGATDVVVSPDGRSVYAHSIDDDAIARFDRSATGVLTPKGCIADVGDTAGCGATAQGLGDGTGVTISPDGRSVYTVAEAPDNAIAHFERDPSSGALTPKGCISDVGDPAGCGATAQGLGGAVDVAVSPDGRSVFTVGLGDDALTRFDRDTTTGALTPRGCIEDIGAAAGCGAAQQGLGGARAVAVSPDDRSVYVGSSADDAIVHLERNPSTRTLAPVGCIAKPGDAPGCGATAKGIESPLAVAVAPAGDSVYVAGNSDDAVAHLDRDPSTGALTAVGCIADVGDVVGCGSVQQGLDGAQGIAVTRDGRSVYAAARTDAALVRLSRDPGSGALSPGACIADVGDAAGCGVVQQGLGGVEAVAASPDGGSVYTVSDGDNAIASFTREPAPQCSDALDNDGDGKTDHPADPGCTSAADNDETDPPAPPGPDPGPGPSPTPDTTAPTLELGGKKKQSSNKRVVVEASCDEACTVTVKPKGKATVKTRAPAAEEAKKSKKKLKLKRAKKSLAAGEGKRLKLAFKGKKTKRLVKKTLKRKRGRIKLRLQGTAVDQAGNKGKDSFTVTLR